jgi:hypothetical protein
MSETFPGDGRAALHVVEDGQSRDVGGHLGWIEWRCAW